MPPGPGTIIKPGSSPRASAPASGSDFVILPATASKRQSICLIAGDTGAGKSTFALRFAPPPIAFINFDGRAEDTVRREQSASRVIHYLYVPYSANVTMQGDEAARSSGKEGVAKTFRNVEWAVRQSLAGNIRTIALDTGTEFNHLLNLSVTGRVDRVKNDFGKSAHLVALEWARLYGLAREGNAHLIVLARAQAIWVGNEPTGEFKYRGPDPMGEGADWAGLLRLKQNKLRTKVSGHELKIIKAGQNLAELGAVYSSADWEDVGGPFVLANTLQFEGSNPEDWQ